MIIGNIEQLKSLTDGERHYSVPPYGSDVSKTQLLKNWEFIESIMSKGITPVDNSIPEGPLDRQGQAQIGRSLIVNDKISDVIWMGGRVFALDFGHNFRRTCQSFKGEQVVLNPSIDPLIPMGSYGCFLDQLSNINLNNTLVVVEADCLNNHPHALSVIFHLLVSHLRQLVAMGDHISPFLIVLEKTWCLLDGKDGDACIFQAKEFMKEWISKRFTIQIQELDEF